MRELAKTAAYGIATLLVCPLLLSYILRRAVIGADRALAGSTQTLAVVPGLVGVYLRRAFLCRTLAHCDRTASVHFGTLFSQTGARLEANVYVGPHCHLGLVHVERDVLIASGVHIPSGGATHGMADLERPIREQEGHRVPIRIDAGAWIGSAAVVMADVGEHAVVGAGSVVTKPVPAFAVVAGVPARVVRDRRTPREIPERHGPPSQ